MNVTRAQQIFNSEQNYQVLFNGSPIWIEDLNSYDQTAMIRMLNSDENLKEVPVAELVEG